MRIFQYTGSHHVAGILKDGMNRGGIPLPDGRVLRGWQWLTTSKDWNQGWATRKIIECDRTEVRFSIAIPRAHRAKLRRWDDVAGQFLPAGLIDDFREQGGGDSSQWYVYHGLIPAGWIRGYEVRPSAIAEQRQK